MLGYLVGSIQMRVHVPEETEPLAHPLSKGRKSLKQEEEEGEAAWLGYV